MSKGAPAGKEAEVTEVARNDIWKERVKRELQSFNLNENFQTNPYSLNVVSDKPNKRGARFLDKDQALLESLSQRLGKTAALTQTYSTLAERLDLKDDDLFSTTTASSSQKPPNPEKERQTAEFNKKLLDVMKTPKEKFPTPKTSSHEIGWFHDPIMFKNESQFFRPRKNCDETVYADALIRSSTVQNRGTGGTKPAPRASKGDK